MKVYIVCQKKPSKIVDVYSDIRTVREVISKNPDNLYSIEKDLLETAQKFKSMTEVNEKVYDPKHFNSIMIVLTSLVKISFILPSLTGMPSCQK